MASTDEALGSLSRCDELRHLYLEHVSRDWWCLAAAAATDAPPPPAPRQAGGNGYSYLVFRRLPALLDCGWGSEARVGLGGRASCPGAGRVRATGELFRE